MTTLPTPIQATVSAIYRWHERRADDGMRGHLGASQIGRECARALWYSWRWAERQQFDGRMLRLFQTGHLAEDRLIAELRGIGVTVWDKDEHGNQYRESTHGGHVSGAADAIAQGFPEAPKATALCEFKTHSAKSFADLAKRGVEQSKPQHWAQVHVNAALFKLDRIAYIAVNKDTDEIYFEWIHAAKDVAQKFLDRALSIINAAEPPVRISDDPAWWQCKNCAFVGQCHGTAAPLVNCRTCLHSTAETDGNGGRWKCEKKSRQAIDIDTQRTGCPQHRYIPALLERIAEPIDADPAANTVTYRNRQTGAEFVNGGGATEVTSAEIRALSDKSMLGQERADPALRGVMADTGARYCA